MTCKRFFGVSVYLSLLIVASPTIGQEEESTPSQKTKEAVEKFKKAPSLAREKMESLKAAAKEKIHEVLPARNGAKKSDGDIDLPKPAEKWESPHYSGQRDPFQPLALKPRAVSKPRANRSPLERYEIGQLKLVGILWNGKEPSAMVEDTTGLGYIVRVGSAIGLNEGKVKSITATDVVIEETYVDFYGATKRRDMRMKLSTP